MLPAHPLFAEQTDTDVSAHTCCSTERSVLGVISQRGSQVPHHGALGRGDPIAERDDVAASGVCAGLLQVRCAAGLLLLQSLLLRLHLQGCKLLLMPTSGSCLPACWALMRWQCPVLTVRSGTCQSLDIRIGED